uniref:TPX2 central domain-containing protein n=1 Tax=Rhizophagus irregularis (strain DAOM 181602 / DAOM 197198 / MUCL 43194) TaxID=747089 RepID=U9T7H2_RHIID
MDATNFNNDKLEVAEKFECNLSRAMSVASRTQTPQNKNYLITKTENKTAEKFECNLSRAMSVASRTQTPQNKNYLVTKTENKTAEKFECNLSRVMSVASNTRTPQNKNYLVTKTEKKTAEKFEDNLNRVMSRTQSPQTKNYLAKKSGGGIQKRAFVPTVPKPFKFYTELRASKSRNKENSPKSPLLENPTRFDAKVSDDNTFQNQYRDFEANNRNFFL